jgi:hypothetical protein
MTTATSAAFLLTFGLCAVIAWAAVFSRGRLWRKVVSLVALAALIPTLYLAVTELLGLPKPVSTTWLENFDEYRRVIAYDIHEDKAIYLWLDMIDGSEPRVFSIPYDKETLSRLQGAQERADSLASQLLARVATKQESRTGYWEFTNETEFVRELPEKPEVEDDDAIAFDSSLGYGEP